MSSVHDKLDRVRKPRVHIKAERSEEHTSELQSRRNLVCRLLLEKKKKNKPKEKLPSAYSPDRLHA